jgi:hypothetical protein
MTMLTLRAYLLLLSFEFVISRRNFARLYAKVRTRVFRPSPGHPEISALACAAIDRACVFYFKEVQCLQRSAATVCLLRDLGVPGALVIGAQHLPFRAHAWVEVDGKVVNDKADVADSYEVLDRC